MAMQFTPSTRLIIILALLSLFLRLSSSFFFSFVADDDASSSQAQLILAQVIWRHGDRAPISTYPTDPNGEDKWPYGWGELTELGMRQHLSLGHLLRKRYILSEPPLLDERYTPKEIYVRSTDVNRTLASAQANLAGMFPAGEPGVDFPSNKKWPSHWTPVPVHTVPETTDHIGNIGAKCPRADQIQARIRASRIYQNISRENADFCEHISEMTGKTFNLTNIDELNDAIFIESLYNLSQPAWLTQMTRQRIQNLTQKSNEFFFGIEPRAYSPELIRLRGGNLLRDMVDRMVLKWKCVEKERRRRRMLKNGQNERRRAAARRRKGEQRNDEEEEQDISADEGTAAECEWISRLKYYAYSAHDTTVAGLLCTFGDEQRVVHGVFPAYTASIAVELWSLEGHKPAVKILYHSSFHHQYRPITDLTKGCPEGAEFCPLDTFQARSAKFMPVNIEKECQPKKWTD